MKALIVATLVLAVRDASAAASKVHVWEKVELTLQAWQTYELPQKDCYPSLVKRVE
jgi:hypothetical protein